MDNEQTKQASCGQLDYELRRALEEIRAEGTSEHLMDLARTLQKLLREQESTREPE